MVDEAVRQRIKYLVEHGDVIPPDPPATRRWLIGLGAVLGALQLVELALHLGN